MSEKFSKPVEIEVNGSTKKFHIVIVDDTVVGAFNHLTNVPVDSGTFNQILENGSNELVDVYNTIVYKGEAIVTGPGGLTIANEEVRNQFYNEKLAKSNNTEVIQNEEVSSNNSNAFQRQLNIRKTLDGTEFANKIFQYPVGFDTQQDHLKITRHEYRRPDINMSKPSTEMSATANGQSYNYNSIGDTVAGKLLGSILLPMPKVADVNGVEWGKSELTSSGLAALGAARIADLGGFFSGKSDEDRRKDSEAIALLTDGRGTNVEGNSATEFTRGAFATLQSGLAGTFLGTTLDPDTALARTSGRVFNPNAEVLFQGPVIRDFSFSFVMIARSEDEGDEIRKIIRFLKLGMAPKFRSTTFLKNPDVFLLEYRSGNETLNTVNRFNPGGLALQTMSVDYSPNGYWSAYRDSQPVQLKMDLSFTELRPIYESDQAMTPENSVGY